MWLAFDNNVFDICQRYSWHMPANEWLHVEADLVGLECHLLALLQLASLVAELGEGGLKLLLVGLGRIIEDDHRLIPSTLARMSLIPFSKRRPSLILPFQSAQYICREMVTTGLLFRVIPGLGLMAFYMLTIILAWQHVIHIYNIVRF